MKLCYFLWYHDNILYDECTILNRYSDFNDAYPDDLPFKFNKATAVGIAWR